MRQPLLSMAAIVFVAATAAATAAATTHTVRPGQSIQEALERAEEGDRVEVEPGDYHESIIVDKHRITLVGLNDEGHRAVLLGLNDEAQGPVFPGGEKLEKAVEVRGDDITVEGFVILDYANSGISAHKAKNLVLRDLIIHNTGKEGIRAVECQDLLVERCVIGACTEAGIAVKQSINVKVRNNEVYNNRVGAAVTNCVSALVENNSAHNNGVGLFIACLPGQSVKEASFARVINNRFRSNNKTFEAGTAAAKPGAQERVLPPGIGIVILAADHTEITQNRIEENGAYGIMVLSHPTSEPAAELDVDPNADHSYIHHNTYHGNGNHPSAQYKRQYPDVAPGDLYWDGIGERNQFQEKSGLKTFPRKLVQEFGGIHTNVRLFY